MVTKSPEFPNIDRYQVVAFDTETTGIEWWKHKMFGFSISLPDGGGDFYWDIRENPNAIDWLQHMLPMCKAIVGHNIKFDCQFVANFGIDLSGVKLYDTMIQAALLNEKENSYSLDYLSKKYTLTEKMDVVPLLAKIFGGMKTRNVQMPRLQYLGRTWPQKPKLDEKRNFEEEMKIAKEYAMVDTRATLELYEYQRPKLIKQNLDRVLRMEMELLPVLYDMERRGVPVDIDQTVITRGKLITRLARCEKTLFDQAGFAVGVDTREDILKLFDPKKLPDGQFRTNGGEIIPATMSGESASFSKAVLGHMKDPKAKAIVDVRAIKKLIGTFIDGHILGNHDNGIIHTSFNQTRTDNETGTKTGRISSSGPNMQQIPKRDRELCEIIRLLFSPYKGQVWSCRDWAQMDFRVFAHYLDSAKINKIFEKNPDADFHQMVADLTGLPRNPNPDTGNAKQLNLAMVFGMGRGRVCNEMGLPTTEKEIYGRMMMVPGEEGERVINTYHDSIPGIKILQDKVSSVAKSRGYIMTTLGRRIRLKRNEAYKAAGLLFQGTAADCLKVKLIEVHNYLKGTEGALLLNVHDEFDTSLPKGGRVLSDGIGEIVSAFGPDDEINLRIPITSDEGVGDNWWDAVSKT